VLLGRSTLFLDRGALAGEAVSERRDIVRQHAGGLVAQALSEGRAGAVRADGDAHGPVADHSREDERAVHRAVGCIDPDARGCCRGGDLVVGDGAGSRDDEAHSVEVTRLEPTAGEHLDVAGIDLARHRHRDLRGDDPHDGPGASEPGDLAGGDRTATHDEDVDTVEIEGNRVGEPRGHWLRTVSDGNLDILDRITRDLCQNRPVSADVDVVDLGQVSASFEDAHPLAILRWAGDQFGDGLLATASFGDAVLVHLVSQAIPDADVVLLDTGYLFAETEWFAERLREQFRLNLRVVHPLADAEPDQWQYDTDGCCTARKVEPLQRALAGRTAWVTGLRRSDSPTRSDAPIVHFDPFRGVTKINPLATWSDDDVAHYSQMELLPEHPLAGRGYASIGCWPCTRPVDDGDHARAGRWAGTDKIECGLHVGGSERRGASRGAATNGLRGRGTQ
jgi:phosphoadenosine phosphosulfate reductase